MTLTQDAPNVTPEPVTEDLSWLRSTCIAVVGDRGSGKTATCCAFLDAITDRPVYVFSHPKPDLVRERGWENMHRLESLYDVSNVVVWLDEPQLSIPKLDKRANEGLQRLLSIARHRDITLLLSTCDTRWITRALEAYVETWVVKDVEPRLVKQGALIKKIIQKFCIVDADEFHLEKDQFLFYNRHMPEMDGLQSVGLPEWWTDEWSKPYALDDPKGATGTAQKVRRLLTKTVR
jgi:hypothetical protein